MALASRGPAHYRSSRHALSRWSAVAVVILLIALVYWIDFFITSDLLVLLYLFPIGLTLHTFGALPAYALCLTAALLGAHSPFSKLIHFLILAILVCAASYSMESLRLSRDRFRRLSQLLPLCPDCGQLLCHDGQWRSVEQAIQHKSSVDFLSHQGCHSTPPTD